MSGWAGSGAGSSGAAPTVTAWSVATALGPTRADHEAALRAGRSGLRPATSVPFETMIGAIDWPLRPLPASLADWESRCARLALHLLDGVAHEAEAARTRWGAERLAVVLGTSTGGMAATERACRALRASGALPADYDLDRQHSFYGAAEVVRRRLRAEGPTYVVSTACSSSGKALGSALRLIRHDEADAVLVAGVETSSDTTLHGFRSLGILARAACRPFALGRDGISLGEGGAMLLIERAGDARVRVLGVGESSDAHHMSAPHPEGEGARLAMEQALAAAGLRAADVDHINAHGTGTPHNDVAEAIAITRVFGRSPLVASTKGYTGHLLGAAGAVEAAFGVLAIEGGFVPASLGASPVDPEIEASIALEPRSLPCRVVLSNSFGFGGSNVSVVLGAVP